MKKYKPKWKPHMFLPKISDEDIEEACRLLMAYEVATIPAAGTYDDMRSEEYIAYMDTLLAQAKAGTLIAPNVPMGWQYYTRKGLAAILIAALLAGIAMPERVMAGYRWLVEVIEEFLVDRTKYIYTSNADEDIEFVPMQFGYLPEGMEQNEYDKSSQEMKVVYNNKKSEEYIIVHQRFINNRSKYVYGSNVEIHYTELIYVNSDIIKLVNKNGFIAFSWLHDNYQISGQTNLSEEKLIKILESVYFE